VADTVIIICEKPDAMDHIAMALAHGALRKRTSRYGIAFYEFLRDGKKHIAVSAVGHLFNLKQKRRGEHPIFDAEWVPSYKASKKAVFSQRYFKTLEDVAKSFDGDLVSACDYDNEGSLIAEKIIKLIFNKEDAGRMKFSTLTKQDLVSAYENMAKHLDTNNINAGETRHYLDWIYGINTSRALMESIKKSSKRFAILSAGRVQAPTLVILADREQEIKNFVPVPYWQLQLTILSNGSEIIAIYEEDKIWEKTKASKILEECKGNPAIVDSMTVENYRQYPPTPFNITSLQTEAYRLFGLSPQQTMSIAQSLYTQAYISYPRTSSERLPPQIGYRQILEALSKIKTYETLCKTLLSMKYLKPNDGKLTDSAHEAIHPTVEPPSDVKKLKGLEQKIYDLICRRYFATFAGPAERETINVVFDVNGRKFLAAGRRTVEKGWMSFYGPYAKIDDVFLPNLKKGDSLDVKDLEMLDKETAPPSRFSQASIIKEMEKRGLGTRATRSGILQTLYDRDYITGRSIEVTGLGVKMSSVIKKYVPDFADEKLTRKFEEELEKIVEGEGNKTEIINEAKDAVKKITDEFDQNQEVIGRELGEAVVKTQDDKSILGKCKCGKDLKIMFSPKTRKYFVGCTGYKEGCKAIYPLPHGASIYKTGKVCDKCGTPIIKVYRGGRRPFSMCLDTKCVTKADWGKPRRTKLAHPGND